MRSIWLVTCTNHSLMTQRKATLIDLARSFPRQFSLCVALDHYSDENHEAVRGRGSLHPAIKGLQWLQRNNFNLALASGRLWEGKSETLLREGFTEVM
jgi:hypothetical protein